MLQSFEKTKAFSLCLKRTFEPIYICECESGIVNVKSYEFQFYKSKMGKDWKAMNFNSTNEKWGRIFCQKYKFMITKITYAPIDGFKKNFVVYEHVID